MNGRVPGDHCHGGTIARWIRVEATMDLEAASDQSGKPKRIGTNARCRDTDADSAQLEAADCVNRRFAENDGRGAFGSDPEVARVLATARRHSTPHLTSHASQFGADRTVRLSSHHQKDRVATLVGIDFSLTVMEFGEVDVSALLAPCQLVWQEPEFGRLRPPICRCQFMNLDPATERGPAVVRHCRLSRRSRDAPQQVNTCGSGMPRTASARRRMSSKFMALRNYHFLPAAVSPFCLSSGSRKVTQSFMLNT